MSLIPISIQLYTLRTIMAENPVAVLRQIADIGYTAVEPAGFYGKSATEFRAIVEDLGMKIGSSHTPWVGPNSIDQAIETAGQLGLKRVVCGYGPEQFASVEAIHRTADEVNAMEAKLNAAGIGLFLHNHWWEYKLLNGRLAIDYFIERAPTVEFELDLYWAACFGENDLVATVKRFAARSPLLHVKDGSLIKDQPNTPLGRGKVDLKAAIKAASPEKLEYLVFEMDSCATDLIEAARESYHYLKDAGLGSGKK